MTNSVRWVYGLMLLICIAVGIAPGAVEAASTPALQRGVNLSHWLQYWGRQPVVAADMAMIKKAGFDHVRIPFNPEALGWNPDATTPTTDWTALDQAMNLALQAQLAVILDFHPESELHNRIETQDSVQQAFLDFWQQMARHYAASPVSEVAFEILNEPQYYQDDGGARWNAVQQQALLRVRQSAPSHLVLLSGNRGGSIAGLL
ncbi:cellulase family glycosylhydrolase, partial [uncultured Thiodictyon sp.]|uniref:glycoside hydrolase family 5 protein n=1 Tax=uncultured Thiodictyon sp. TaxID=1846217 RepID=UPI0025FF67AB